MKVTATISSALPEESGTSKAGKPWRKRQYVATYDSSKPQYPKAILVTVMGENIEKLNLQEGCQYELDIDFEVNLRSERYYMDVNCWRAKEVNPSI